MKNDDTMEGTDMISCSAANNRMVQSGCVIDTMQLLVEVQFNTDRLISEQIPFYSVLMCKISPLQYLIRKVRYKSSCSLDESREVRYVGFDAAMHILIR